MPLLGPPRSRTATFSGTCTSGIGAPHLDISQNATVNCPGGSASITCSGITKGFEEDLTYVSTPPWPGTGATKRWRATMTAGSDRQASGPAGALASTHDSLTVVGPWLIYHWPNAPTEDPSAYPNYGTILDNIAMSGSASFNGSLTLEDDWSVFPSVREKITAATLNASFSATASATFYYFDDANAQQSLSISYSYSGSVAFSSSPNTTLSTYSVSISAATYTTVSWSLSWSLPGTAYSAGSATLHDTHNRIPAGNFTGTTDASGTAFSGTLTNTGAGVGPLYNQGFSSCSFSQGPDRAFGATASLRRYRDGGGIAGAPLKFTTGPTDPGMTVSTDGAGSVTSFVWPYDGSIETEHFYQVNGNGPFDGSHTPAAVANFSVLLDPTWADANGYFLKTGSLGNSAGLMQYRSYRPFQIGSLQLDDSHAFDFFSSLTWWNGSAGLGSGTLSLNLGGVKLAPASWPWRVNTVDTVKSLKCAFYRYYTVRVRSDTAGATLKFGVGHRAAGSGSGFNYWYWTITISAANTWEDHVIDLALPESDSAGTSPINYLKHPSGWFQHPWGAFEITANTSGANYWIESFTGFLKQTGNRIPALLAGSLNAGFANVFYDHTGSVVTDGGQTVERDYQSAADYSRAGVGGRQTFGRFLVNGVIAADIAPISNGAYVLPGNPGSTCQGFWTAFRNFWDDAVNDTGLHIVDTADPQGGFDDLIFSWKRDGALWHRLNDTPGSPVTLDVYAEPLGGTMTGFPGMGDFFAGSYGVRTVFQFHHYLEGEMAGCLAKDGRPLAGKSISFYRNTDTTTVIGTATSNDDGLWRWFAPYGAVQPYSNHPTGAGTSGNPDWQKEFTNFFGGPPTAWNSTALARRFQPYIAKSKNFLNKDASLFALKPGTATRQLLYSLDRWMTYFGYGDAIGSELGIDLARNPWNWIFRSYLKDSTPAINVGRLIYGQPWVDVQVATDQDSEAVPTLFADASGAVMVLYHDTSNQGRFWWSVDQGATWSDRATWAGVGKYPRAALLPDNTLLIISYVGTGLTVHKSIDWQTASPPTLTSIATVASVPEQLAGLQVDRHGIAHRIHVTATPELLHSFSADGTLWSTPTVLAAGDHAAYALGIERGVYARWAGSLLALELSDEAYGTASAIPAFDLTALPAFATQYLGVLWDARETVLVAGIDPSTGDPVVYYSPERHTVVAL